MSERARPGYHRETITSAKNRYEAIAAVYTPNIPSEVDGETAPILLPNGWGAGVIAMSGIARNLATRKGRTAIVFDHKRDRMRGESPTERKVRTLTTVAEAAQDRLKAEELEVIAHSEGGINGAKFILDQIAKGDDGIAIARATLFAPAGVIDLSRNEIETRSIHEVFDLYHPRQVPNLMALGLQALDAMMYIAKNAQLSNDEIDDIAKAQITPDIDTIHAAGVPIGVAGGRYDNLFPIWELQEALPNQVPTLGITTNHIDFFNKPRVLDEVYDFHRSLGHTAAAAA